MTLDEQIVSFAEHQERCVGTQAIFPPPADCPGYVHTLYGIAEWHIFTVVIVLMFVGMLIQFVALGFSRGGGH